MPSIHPKRIFFSHAMAQLKKDLIGKDSYRGVTLTYSWLANQVGHICLGFIPTCILYHVYAKHTNILNPALWAAITITGTWLVFELFNFLEPLLNTKKQKKQMNRPKESYVFKPAWGNVAFDTATDVLFFGFGAFFAAKVCNYHAAYIAIIWLSITVLLVYPVAYWYVTKMYIQAAQYPFQGRLSQWKMGINNRDRDIVIDFLKPQSNVKHLLVFGENGSGKTSLSVGIATEFSIKNIACNYLTMPKLFSAFYEPTAPSTSNTELWNWRNTSVLLIDDINPSNPQKKDIINTATFIEFMNHSIYGAANTQAIANTKTIWVLGNDDETNNRKEEWIKMLGSIDVQPASIASIHLFKA
jgi:hypothetical protein